MKKRWGKPITQVQRFVAQEFVAACDTYDLTTINLGTTIYCDYYNNTADGKYQTYEQGTYLWGKSAHSNVPASSVTDVTAYKWYERTSAYAAPANTKYSDDDYFTTYTPPYTIYRYGTGNYSFYTGTKNQS